MNNQTLKLDSCGCCEGIRSLTPEAVQNGPGLTALVYRAGTHSTFKASMKSLLSTKGPLEDLTTRDDDDPAIALLDSWATVLDVLTFYQERIANEGYLRTSQHRRSVLELARHISYMLLPGVAASTYLAFTIDDVKGSPSEATIHQGTKVQSIPGQDELPQVFETVEEIQAKREWNAIKPQLNEKFTPGFRDKEVYLKGILTGLKPGDGILMIGAERRKDIGSERWDFRRIKEVVQDKDKDLTQVTWDEGLGWQIFSRIVLPAEKNFQVFAFREQDFLFGHNAPDWRIISDEVKNGFVTTGLLGEYYNNMNFTAKTATRIDAKIDFDWGGGKPHPDISSNTFSVRWTGFIKPLDSGEYTFYTDSDDGVRLWVDNKLIINHWTDHAVARDSGSIWLETGKMYDIRLDYYENGGLAVIKLSWDGPGTGGEEIIPQGRLYPPGNYDDWPGLNIASISNVPDGEEIETIFLDGLHPKIVKDSWLVLSTSSPRQYVEVYEVNEVSESFCENFTLASKTTAVTLKGENLREKFNESVRETVVFAQNEELEMAERPVTDPVQGHIIALEELLPDLPVNRPVIVSGKRSRVRVSDSAKNLVLSSTEDSQYVSLEPGDSLVVMQAPEYKPGGKITWILEDKHGFIGTITTKTGDVNLISADEDDETVSEVVFIESVTSETDPTQITLADPLVNIFDRSTVDIYGNVAAATHGETKTEILGSGDGSLKFQNFQLKQKPLTFVSAANASGTQTTLEIRVNDVLWEEVPTFYGAAPEDRVYVTRIADDGIVTVQFGDGITGARLPTGTENVKATYRIGTGLDGLLDERQLALLMTPQLGVKEVVNPLKPNGAEDQETLDKARRNAPLTVLTMDRIVSLQDFEDFTRAFAGIGKARADLLWKGEQRVIHITVAAADGGGVETTSELYRNLTSAIDAARHSNYQVQVASFKQLTFDLKAKVIVDEKYIAEDVLAAVSDELQQAFSFDARDFGQDVTPSEITAVMQGIDGVIAVDLELINGQNPFSVEHFRIRSETARWDGDTIVVAELLTVNPNGIEISEMML